MSRKNDSTNKIKTQKLLVHHFDTVAGSFPNCSANHLLVRFLSARTTFIRFISLSILIVISKLCGKYSKKITENAKGREKTDEKSHFYCVFLIFHLKFTGNSQLSLSNYVIKPLPEAPSMLCLYSSLPSPLLLRTSMQTVANS